MYDYIVIGAGSAGCVVAARLSENPRTTVLLLEAGGPDDRPEIQIPYAAWSLQGSDVDWAYLTEPQAQLGARRIAWPRGKLLGGTSSINAMVYMRGHPQIYDGWLAAGNAGWGYADLLPLFKRSERQARGADEYHGGDGPLDVADQRDANPLSCAFVDAARELGYPINDDFNAAEQVGFGFYQVTQRQGQRWSAADAFLKPAMARQNLHVAIQAQATRLLFEGRRAAGVAYIQHGETREAHASGEVILCGGAINSPQLLLLSGIGPADDLRALGIPVIADLPGVGQNLQDHLDVAVAFRCTEPISLGTLYAAAEIEYRYFRKGPLASNGPEAGGFLKTRPQLPAPDLQFHFSPGWSVGFGTHRPAGHGFSLWPALVLPESRGSLRLRAADPLAPPLIQPNYLAAEPDIAVIVQGVQIARELAATRAFAPFVGEAIQPGAELRSDEEIRAYIRASASTVYHPTGTCKMGLDPLAVVDSQLRVHGVDGLRVADASIMPAIVNGNTNAPVIMIGEKLAELIEVSSQSSSRTVTPSRPTS
ncbi:MAG TPA: choline dehydrogenase [Roseiflexaceae bacterium]|nr:choline dehydrogenase [Roseiflexaceae bacterium]